MDKIIQQPNKLCRIDLDANIPCTDSNFLNKFYLIDKQANWQLTIVDSCVYQLTNKKTNLSMISDFRQGNYPYRQHNLGKEYLLQAIRIKEKLPKKLFDATPGMLKDSLMLENHGINIIAVERHPLLYIMVKQALSHIKTNINYHFGDSIKLMKKFPTDIIYLDPMYPPRKKSAKVKKNMQILQDIVGPDIDSTTLFTTARQQQNRIVVKRPKHAKPLVNAPPPTFSVPNSKNKATTRFDIYLP